jgi:citrate lyase subunit beta/citryl-CoA lyase
MRSLLFVPADSDRKLAKSLDSDADILLLDLEDSVAPGRKEAARATARDFLGGRPAGRRAYVRINPLATALALPDLEAVIAGRPDGIMLPKAAGGDEVRALDRELGRLEDKHGLAAGAAPRSCRSRRKRRAPCSRSAATAARASGSSA